MVSEPAPQRYAASAPVDEGLAVLLDPVRLSEMVGASVRVSRIRPKPGVSHAAALVSVPDGHLIGWVQALLGPAQAKLEKIRLRAAEVGRDDEVHEAPLPAGAGTLVWGPVGTDPRLSGPLAQLGPQVRAEAQLLRYNPLRRVVLRHGDHVVRVTAHPHRDRLQAVCRSLAALGAPVLVPRSSAEAGLPGGRRVSVWPWMEGRDLAAGASREEMRRAGAALDVLHRTPPVALDLPHRDWSTQRQTAGRTVRLLDLLVPDLAVDALAALDALPREATEVSASEPVVLHGDFSLDQCLLADAGDLVLADLDRACIGPPEIDLAEVEALSGLSGRGVGAVLEGYGAPARPDRAWVAAAVLARITEPWRFQDDGWQEETVRRGRLALRLLQSRASTPQVVSPDGPGPWLVPDILSDPYGDRIVVDRAWPDKAVDGVPRIAVEGRDEQDRLRAGTLDHAGTVLLHPPGSDRRLPGLRRLVGQGDLVVHRSGRRAVVRLPDAFVKVVRPGRAAAVAQAATTGRQLAAAAGLAAPGVRTSDEDSVTFEVLPGTPVHELSADPAWGSIWTAFGDGWSRLQALDPDAEGRELGLVPHTPRDEAHVLRVWEARARTARVLERSWGDRLLAVAEELDALPLAGLVPAHRDLHDKQLLWHDGSLGVLDLDTACLAEPALDLANLAVHARLRVVQGRWTPAAAGRVERTTRELALAAGVPLERWEVAERATLARLVAVYAFRPKWRSAVAEWAAESWSDLHG